MGQIGPAVSFLLRAAVVAVALFALTALGVGLHALWLHRIASPPQLSAAIIVLGGGAEADGSPGPDTLRRVRHGVALFEAGLAPRIHFSGAHTNPDVLGLGDSMAMAALDAGVPKAAISVEGGSRSTLQNALFSREVLPPGEARPAILVSDGYHLARAWASFRWAGYERVRLSAATAFGGGRTVDKLWRLTREALAVWFNAGRALLWSALVALGFDGARHVDMLASAAPTPDGSPPEPPAPG